MKTFYIELIIVKTNKCYKKKCCNDEQCFSACVK